MDLDRFITLILTIIQGGKQFFSEREFSLTISKLFRVPMVGIFFLGRLYKSLIILVNINGPNWNNPQFFAKLIASLPSWFVDTYQLIIAGHLNFVLTLQLDRSNPKPNSQSTKVGNCYQLLHAETVLFFSHLPTKGMPEWIFFYWK